jgi:GNAT superfamily N-acetyltransferase
MIEAVQGSGLEAAYPGRVQGWPETPRNTGKRVKRWLKWLLASDIDVIVGEVDGEIVGFCTVRPGADHDLYPVPEGEIPTVYVHPENWSRGYGRLPPDLRKRLMPGGIRWSRSLVMPGLQVSHEELRAGSAAITKERPTPETGGRE